MPSIFGLERKKMELIRNLGLIFEKIHKDHLISTGDFPDLKRMQEQLLSYDFSKFNSFNQYLIDEVDKMLAKDIAKLMAMIPLEDAQNISEDAGVVKGGVFDSTMDSKSVFGSNKGEGINAGVGDPQWIIAKDKYKYDAVFDTLNPIDGKVTGSAAKEEMVKSKLPNSVLGNIYSLADIDKDGMLDSEEFAIAMYLIGVRLDGYDIPTELPDHLIPPSKQNLSELTS